MDARVTALRKASQDLQIARAQLAQLSAQRPRTETLKRRTDVAAARVSALQDRLARFTESAPLEPAPGPPKRVREAPLPDELAALRANLSAELRATAAPAARMHAHLTRARARLDA